MRDDIRFIAVSLSHVGTLITPPKKLVGEQKFFMLKFRFRFGASNFYENVHSTICR